MLAVSAGLSAGFSEDLSKGFSTATADFSTTVGRSAAVCSSMAFSEMPFALTPGSGMLPASADLAGDLGSVLVSALA